MRIYLDACIVIYLVERNTIYQPKIKTALAKRPEQHLCWTDLTRLEVRVKPLRDNDTQLLANFDLFLTSSATRQIHIGREVFDLATDLRARHNLKTPDALHLASAIEGGCEQFWSNDARLEKAAAGHIALVTFP